MVSWHLGPPPEVVPRELDSLGVALDRVLVMLPLSCSASKLRSSSGSPTNLSHTLPYGLLIYKQCCRPLRLRDQLELLNLLPVLVGFIPTLLETKVASDDLRDALSAIFGLSELKRGESVRIGAWILGDFVLGSHAKGYVVMSADSAVTYTSVHSEARSWSIPSEDPYEEAARQLLEQAPRSPEYVPDPIELEDHVPVYIPEPEHPEDLVPAEDEAPTPPLPQFFLSPRIRPPRNRATIAQMRATSPYTYHPLLPLGTSPLLPIPLPTPSTSRRADIPEADTPPRKRLLLTTPRPSSKVGESSAAAAARQPGPTMAHRVEYSLVDTMETRFPEL
ncbi:hypothetical protein Tco_0018520 [Tanacetum coccineum]